MATTSNKSKFNPTGENSNEWSKLIQDMKEWREITPHPKEWIKPQQFTKEYPKYSEFDSTTFRSAYNRAKAKIIGTCSHFKSNLILLCKFIIRLT